MKKTYALLLILLAAITAASPVIAQAYRSQLHFLEQFAIRQYERGDKENAQKQFGWILRIEPNNPIAREYLERMASETSSANTLAPEDRSQIISDISSVKNDLSQYEQDARELERLIRDLITENDALYQALYKRSREVAEMRQKFYGTPYEKAYFEAMKSVPIDRIPQRLHPLQDILPEDTATLTKAEEEEISAILKDIAALSEKQRSSVNQEQFDSALRAKRDILIKKTMALAEKRDSLNRLKNELSDINTGLKQSSSRYIQAIQKIDAYYSRFKEKMAKKNYVEQKMFSELISDYARKVKELEELKNSVRDRDNTLTSFKPDIASTNDRLRNIDEELKVKDEEITQFKNLVMEYKQQLSERDAALKERNETIRTHETLIQNQGKDLSLTDKKLNAMDRQVSSIEHELRKSDIQLAQLKANIAARTQKNIPDKAAEEAIKKEAALLKASIEEATQNIATAKENLERMRAREAKLLTQTQALEKENANLRQANLDTTTQIAARSKELTQATEQVQALKKTIDNKDKRIAELSKQVESIQQQLKPLLPIPANLAKAEAANTDLEKRLREAFTKITKAETELTRASSEAAALKEQLANPENQRETSSILRIKKDDADKKLLMNAILLKDQELAELKEELADLQHAHDLLASEHTEIPLISETTTPVEEDQQRDLALQEKDAQINALRQELINYAAREIKQKAIDDVVHDRDMKILTLQTEVQRLKDELAAGKALPKH